MTVIGGGSGFVTMTDMGRNPPASPEAGCEGPCRVERDDQARLRIYPYESKNGTLYIGVTNNLAKRVWEHKHDLVEGFTKRYRVHRLVYHETYRDIREALLRERRIKKWNRKWKIQLIEGQNPEWNDLYDEL